MSRKKLTLDETAVREFARLTDHYSPMLGVDPRTRITVVWDDEFEQYAGVNMSTRRRLAEVTISGPYTEQSYRDRCQTVIHELLHIAQCGPYTMVHEAHEAGVLGESAPFLLAFVQQHELFTDTLAEVLVDLLPMPEE